MRFIGIIVVVLFIFILMKFYMGMSLDGKDNEVIKQREIYRESQEKLKRATKTLELEYGKYEDIEGRE
ncbi:hypothetical protein PM10SUCC1_04800 [Propionigenium maris DSM 9537]|uniref:Uncharacterized protein n=1 Tax=Propionigenium maris DSM 9537 TaxID=1123000 RepID=A0A9W6LMI9_9FUSO|nr:hypothetical protein [Propionigenium maris]GLI54965.1 hypothetical protein PM10SUCC1_04800 [Propionigenium maris DSM 9537]